MVNKWLVVGIIILIVVVFGAVLVWTFILSDGALRHDTDRWAVIQDSHGDHIAIETVNNQTWSSLVELYQNQSVRWIGGIVESYDNIWSFRFKPETITVAEVTAEGLQAWIGWISEDLDSWIDGWAYVSARVTEIHVPSQS